MTDMATHQHHREHHHDHIHLDEAGWRVWAAHLELEGEVLLPFVTDTAAWVTEVRGPDAPPVRRVIDIGSGPGVGTCELARQFPYAEVIAVDSSPTMLDRTKRRAAGQDLEARISTHIAELPGGLEGFGRADVIWASMALHHIGDEVTSLRILRDLLDPYGLIAIAERAEPMRVLPDGLDLGRPGLFDRLDRAEAKWFAGMREGLTDGVPSTDLPSMLAAGGLEVVGTRPSRIHLDAPLPVDARQVAFGHLRRMREQFEEHLDHDDLHTLDVLTDADDPRSVRHRPDVFVAASRQIFIARPIGGR
jgi:SAM-dependent methyltransferase